MSSFKASLLLLALLTCLGVCHANELEQQVNFLLANPNESLASWQGLGVYEAPDAQEQVAQMAAALSEFRILTERMGKRVTKKDKEGLPSVGWEIQNIGFENWTQGVMASLYELDYLKYLLTYRCLQMKKPAVSAEELENFHCAVLHKKRLYEEYVFSIVVYD